MSKSKHLLPLNLQLFAEEPPVGGGEPNPSNPQGGEPQQPPKGGEPQNTSVNNAPVKSAEEIQAEFLKSLGVNSIEDAQKAIKGFGEFQESQKTEAQKQADAFQKAQDQIKSQQSELSTINAKYQAVTKGVNPDAVEDVIKLVQGAEDIGKAIDEVLTKYPHFGKAQSTDTPKPSFGTPKYNEPQTPSEIDKWVAAFKGIRK